MPAEFASLLEKFPPQNAEMRAALLDFARTAPLVYGPWKTFKKLFKLAEAPALQDSGEVDIELLGVLIARLDRAEFVAATLKIQPIAPPSADLHDAKTVAGNGFSFTVAPRQSWDSSGWRLVIRADNPASSLFAGFAALRRVVGLESAPTAEAVTAFDFSAGTYIGYLQKVALKGTILEVKSNYATTQVDVSDPRFLFMNGQGPSLQTLHYMKRRARRVMRRVSQKRPELYVALARQVLRESGALDAAGQWAAMDILFANSPRWSQPNSGRGPYRAAPKLVLKRREERAPQLWDANLNEVRALLADDKVPPQANEMALKILRANRQELPPLPSAQLLKFLHSDSALLQSLATRQLSTLWREGALLDAADAALLMVSANAQNRRFLAARLETILGSSNAGWRTAFTASLVTVLRGETGSALTRRRRSAARLVIAHFEEQLSEADLWANLEFFASLGQNELEWTLRRVRASSERGNLGRLDDIARLPQLLRDQVLTAFLAGVAQSRPSATQALQLVTRGETAQNETGWQFLAASAIAPATLREVWRAIFEQNRPQVQATAFSHPSALELFRRAEIPRDELEAWLQSKPFPASPTVWTQIKELFSPPFFAALLERVPASLQVALMLDASASQWDAARAVLGRALGDENLLVAFWQSVFDRFKGDDTSTLQDRILRSDEIAASFERIPTAAFAEFLSGNTPEHEPLLLRWLSRNANTLQRSDPALIAAATHLFPAVREAGLGRVRELGLDVPLALRLMESGLPQPFEVGRAFFDAAARGGGDEMDFALALCDSPNRLVREHGRGYILARQETLLRADLLRRLSEHFDAAMQAWVAEQLLQRAPEFATQSFDAAILRSKGRARRAKEAVKQRLSQSPENATAADALLEVARGRTARDREWALQQLARQVLAGENVAGVAVKSRGD